MGTATKPSWKALPNLKRKKMYGAKLLHRKSEKINEYNRVLPYFTSNLTCNWDWASVLNNGKVGLAFDRFYIMKTCRTELSDGLQGKHVNSVSMAFQHQSEGWLLFFVHERETYHQGTLSNECFDFWTNRFMLQFDNVIESTSFIDCLWVVAALIDIDGN